MLTLADAIGKYGPIELGKWTREIECATVIIIPDDIAAGWIKTATGNPTKHVYGNKDLQSPLLTALDNIKQRGLLSELKTFDGCLEIRDVRGDPGNYSAHSWGLAIDINASENRLGQKTLMTLPFSQCWKDAGFRWGAEFHRCDSMHYTLGW